MQQEMARQMAIITKMQNDLIATVQQIMAAPIAEMKQTEGTFLNGTPPPVLVTPSKTREDQEQGISSPSNTAVSASSIKHSSTANTTK
eukprot:2380111-Ditylum_brightwellii.AAC.1